ncbi:MAG: hypothetical protein V1902_02260 [Candidatus Falkowbacteria bacterium]
MPNFEAARKFEAAKKIEPAEQVQALITADGWIRSNDVEFKKDKQGRWRERTAFVNAPGVYANKERIATLNMENVANELGAKFEVKQKPEKVYEAQVLTEKQEKRLRKKPLEAEIIEEASIIPFPPPLPKQPEVKIEDLLADIKKQTAPERAKEEKRAKMTPTERAVADVVEITAEDVATEHALADKEIAGKKAEEEFDFLGKQPTLKQQEATVGRERKRAESTKQKEQEVSKKLFEEFAALQDKKEELERLLAAKEKSSLPVEKLGKAISDKELERLLAAKEKSSLQTKELRSAIKGINNRLKSIEDAIEYQTTLDSIVRPLTAGGARKPKVEQPVAVEQPIAEPEIQLETPAAREPSIYEKLNELPNLADLRAEEQRASAIASATKKKEPAIMRELQKDFSQMQEQLDYNQNLLRKLKADAGFWKLLFNKETRDKIKHVEGKIDALHEKMDNLLGDRDIGEVIGEQLIAQEARGSKATTAPEAKAETKGESPEQQIATATNFDQLYATLQNLKVIEGGRNKTYAAQELITRIAGIRDSFQQSGINFEITENAPLLNPITRTLQLRKKVAELLNAEISNVVEQKKAQAA